ncbi:hypothetical protein [Pedobacter africanus]|uniref:Uncharacterized protein n=1 Tax=Pedobacter africanus TaxID=151894 RepID=A0A1W2CQY9_9SPHI|nr:hypothetical protein [Pedobacter africanus]SMC87650.1 hypothetical protein SAMN04488524_3129 [Pedobacter africanus]
MDNNINQERQAIAIDFEQEWVPEKAKKLKPLIYKNSDPEGDAYCCLFGPDPEVGIYGCGNTPENAVLDWDKDLQDRMEKLTEGDDAAQHAIKHLSQH